MSRLAQPNGDDYPDAARKHLADAAVLFPAGRHDGTAYLAGYVVECALKTLIQVETGTAEHSHDLGGLQTVLRTLATQVGARTANLYGPVAMLLSSAGVRAWKPEMRYRGPEIAVSEAEAWLHEAGDLYSRTIGQLILDGVI